MLSTEIAFSGGNVVSGADDTLWSFILSPAYSNPYGNPPPQHTSVMLAYCGPEVAREAIICRTMENSKRETSFNDGWSQWRRKTFRHPLRGTEGWGKPPDGACAAPTLTAHPHPWPPYSWGGGRQWADRAPETCGSGILQAPR